MLHLRSTETHHQLSQNCNHPHHNISSIFKTDAIIISSCLILIGIGIFIAYLCYRKYRTRHLYNQSPQAFSRKPHHNLINIINLAKNKFVPLNPEGSNCPSLIVKQLYQGKIYQMSFVDGIGGMYFNHQLHHTSYFQIEFLQQNSLISIGFVHADDLQKLNKGQQLARYGVCISNYGTVLNSGHRVYSYELNLKYGDTLGMGITTDDSNNQRRVWISHNGNLLNPPTSEEVDSWISKQKFDQNEKKEYQNKRNVQDEDFQDDLHRNSNKNKETDIKTDLVLAKKKITLNSTKSFKYYAVVTSSEGKNGKNSIINVNIGAQVFRLFEKSFSGGLLN